MTWGLKPRGRCQACPPPVVIILKPTFALVLSQSETPCTVTTWHLRQPSGRAKVSRAMGRKGQCEPRGSRCYCGANRRQGQCELEGRCLRERLGDGSWRIAAQGLRRMSVEEVAQRYPGLDIKEIMSYPADLAHNGDKLPQLRQTGTSRKSATDARVLLWRESQARRQAPHRTTLQA